MADENTLRARLRAFRDVEKITSKGSLGLVVQLTDQMAKKSPPWSPEDFLTAKGGQVGGLGGPNLARILKAYGITRVLASEAGRTSRGNMDRMKRYVVFMNDLADDGLVDFAVIGGFWAEEVRNYFNSKPFTLSADEAKTLSANFEDVFAQARQRQAENPGAQYLGTVLQHLVGAKLELVLPEAAVQAHGASVADAPTDRGGDFVVNGTAIHCTTAPGSALIAKCQRNLSAGMRPIIITLYERVATAQDLAADAGLAGRLEVWDIQQFLTTNLHEWTQFDAGQRNAGLSKIIAAYNTRVLVENDPSLRIAFDARGS